MTTTDKVEMPPKGRVLTPQPSPTQLETVRKIITHGRLVRHFTGPWTYPGCRPPAGQLHGLSWSVPTSTVRAMDQRGWLRRAEVIVETWRDDRLLTDAGRALAQKTVIQ